MAGNTGLRTSNPRLVDEDASRHQVAWASMSRRHTASTDCAWVMSCDRPGRGPFEGRYEPISAGLRRSAGARCSHAGGIWYVGLYACATPGVARLVWTSVPVVD